MIAISNSTKKSKKEVGKLKEYWSIKEDKLNPNTQTILNEYLLSLKLANRSKKTIRNNHDYLKRVFIDITMNLNMLTSDDILNYIREKHINLKERTALGYISILSTFFRFCTIEGYIDKVLVKKRWRPKVPYPIPKYLDKSDLAKVKLEAEKLSLRDRTIFEFMLTSGSRVGEVCRLNVEDIDLKNRSATVLGKGKKIRHVHFTEGCAILLEKYIETHLDDTGALFLSINNKRLTIGRIQVIVSELGKRANLKKMISCHFLRHTYATLLLSKGYTLEFIASELGHNDINTTRIYARLLEEQMIALYRRYMG